MESAGVTDAGVIATSQPTTRRMDEMRPEDFFELLVAQMRTQDPMEPMSNSEIVQQISQIRDLEASTKLSNTLDKLAEMQQSLTDQQRMGSASALVGSYIEGAITDEEGNSRFVAGVVTGVRFDTTGKPILQLHQGDELDLGQVMQVTSIEEVNRVALKLIGKVVRGEMPDESGSPITIEGLVEDVRTDDIGLPVLILDDGTEMPLQYFRQIVEEQNE
ncbi:MAG: hypothetical protein JSU68_00065 [Phycisphaerales bacterium]|nr:MAG: hypothetical protein JSU68_00065 [Phycisphaerales bacterium]